VELERQDLAAELPRRRFDLIFCRNLAFTYFDAERARLVLEGIADRLRPSGALVVGVHERLPQPTTGFEPWPGCARSSAGARLDPSQTAFLPL
jgi:chemotaxis protein methyltransferase CheR